jgi:nucleotide-binding universal stress UspA family protein
MPTVAASKRRRTDLIAMGTHGGHGVDHLLLGGVAGGIVRATTVPVLLLRKG